MTDMQEGSCQRGLGLTLTVSRFAAPEDLSYPVAKYDATDSVGRVRNDCYPKSDSPVPRP